MSKKYYSIAPINDGFTAAMKDFAICGSNEYAIVSAVQLYAI